MYKSEPVFIRLILCGENAKYATFCTTDVCCTIIPFCKKEQFQETIKRPQITMTFMPVMSVCKHPTDTAAHGSFFNR